LAAQALVERARCRALYSGDLSKSIGELGQFTTDPWRSKPAAPLAIVQLAVWLRGQNKDAEALGHLAKFRSDYGKRANADPAPRGLLAYHHGLLLHDAGNRAEARDAFGEAIKLTPDSTEGADAVLRWALCRKEEAVTAKTDEDFARLFLEAAVALDEHAGRIKDQQHLSDIRRRLLV